MSVEFSYNARGGSAGINAAEFWTCGTCGAAIVEMDRSIKARDMHESWHEAQHNDEPASLAAPIDPAVSVASIDEARMEMVHDLHRAVFGYSGARPETPQQVWRMLLDEVARRFR